METRFKPRSYGYYGEQYLNDARDDLVACKYERALLSYQHSIECSLKEVLSCSKCTDKTLMQTHKVLRLAVAVFGEITDEERYALRALGLAHFQLRYPVDDEIEDDLITLEDPNNNLLDLAESIAVKSLEAAKEARKLLGEELSSIKKLKLF